MGVCKGSLLSQRKRQQETGPGPGFAELLPKLLRATGLLEIWPQGNLTTTGHSELTQKTAPHEGSQASLGDIGDFFLPACSDLVMGFNSLIATQTPACHIQ